MKKRYVKSIIIFILLVLLVFGLLLFYNSKSHHTKTDNKIINNIGKNKASIKKNRNNNSKKKLIKNKSEKKQVEEIKSVDTTTENSNSDFKDTYIKLESYRINITNNVIRRGDTARISVTYNPENATDTNTYYSSSNKNVAIVTNNGIVTGVNSGYCYINVYVKNAKTGRIKIQVVKDNGVVDITGY